MKIFINGEEIEFEIENEKTAGDIIENILQFLESNKFIANQILLNDNQISYNKKSEFDNIDIKNIESIKISAVSKDEYTLLEASKLLNDFRLLKKASESSSDYLIENFIENIEPIENLLYIIIKQHIGLFDILKKLLSEKPYEYSAITTISETIITVLKNLTEDIQFPDNSSKNIIDTLSNLKNEIENISVLIQTNKEKEAYDIIIMFSDLSNRLLNNLSRLKERGSISDDFLIDEETSLSKLINDFKSFLSEITDAMENSDTILTGDIFEYEIIPCIEKFELLKEKF